MASCDQASIGFDWQFNANAAVGDIKPESPLMALYLLTELCRYDPASGVVICDPQADSLTVGSLIVGQEHNPAAQQQYRDCRGQHVSLWDFWLLVVRSHGGRTPNFDQARASISWQAQNNPNSINNARSHWLTAIHSNISSEPKKYFQIMSMYYLLRGQRHNADVMQNYRACFARDAVQLFSAL
jgi:hypothetical protein